MARLRGTHPPGAGALRAHRHPVAGIRRFGGGDRRLRPGGAIRFGLLSTTVLLLPGLLTTDMIVGGWWIHQAIGLATAWGSRVARDHPGEPRADVAGRRRCRRPWRARSTLTSTSWSRFRHRLPCAAPLPGWRCSAADMGPVDSSRARWSLPPVMDLWVCRNRRHGAPSDRGPQGWRVHGGHGNATRRVITNVRLWWHRPLTPLVVIATLCVVVALAWRCHKARRDWRDVAWLGVCAAVMSVPVTLWHVFANNTVQIHASFMYRSLPIAFGAIAALIVAAVSVEPTLTQRRGRDAEATVERVESGHRWVSRGPKRRSHTRRWLARRTRRWADARSPATKRIAGAGEHRGDQPGGGDGRGGRSPPARSASRSTSCRSRNPATFGPIAEQLEHLGDVSATDELAIGRRRRPGRPPGAA